MGVDESEVHAMEEQVSLRIILFSLLSPQVRALDRYLCSSPTDSCSLDLLLYVHALPKPLKNSGPRSPPWDGDDQNASESIRSSMASLLFPILPGEALAQRSWPKHAGIRGARFKLIDYIIRIEANTNSRSFISAYISKYITFIRNVYKI